MTVYVVDTGDYEQNYVVLVANSIEAAHAGIRAAYAPPYQVRWELDGNDLIGHFESVPGYAAQHTARFHLEAYDLVT